MEIIGTIFSILAFLAIAACAIVGMDTKKGKKDK